MAFRIMRLKRQARWSNRLQEIFLVSEQVKFLLFDYIHFFSIFKIIPLKLYVGQICIRNLVSPVSSVQSSVLPQICFTNESRPLPT